MSISEHHTTWDFASLALSQDITATTQGRGGQEAPRGFLEKGVSSTSSKSLLQDLETPPNGSDKDIRSQWSLWARSGVRFEPGAPQAAVEGSWGAGGRGGTGKVTAWRVERSMYHGHRA
jgi:hypothetical protein